MVKKRIVSVLIILMFVLGVSLPRISASASGFGEGKAVGNNEAGKNTEEVTAGIKWKLTFYERKDLRNSAYKVRELCRDSDLLERIETVKEAEQEVEAALDTPWAKAYCAFLGEVLDDSSKMMPTGFRLVYIDDDDVPELLMMEDNSHAAGVKVCTYYQNSVVEIGEFGSMGQLNYAARRGRICGFFMGQGETFSDYYALDHGKAEEIAVFHTYPDLDYEDYSVTLYEADGESVTEALYNEKMHKLEGDDIYEYINYDAAIFVEDMENLKRALAQEIVAAKLKDSLTPMQREAMEAYEDFLEEYAEEFMENHNAEWEDYEKYDDYKGAKFIFLYLDNDEIPELAIATTPMGKGVSLYTYDGLKVAEVGNFGDYGEIAYIEKEGILLSEYYRHSQGYYRAYQVEGTEAEEFLWIEEEGHSLGNPQEGEGYNTYTVDGEKVTEAEYMALYDKYKEYHKRAKKIAYKDFFVMLDGNLKGNLNQAMEELLFEENPFFYPRENTLLSADIQYEDFEGPELRKTINGEVRIKWLKGYDNGDLFRLSVLALDDVGKTSLGPERKNIYLYVTPDEIYRLWSYYYDENGQPITFYDDDSLLMETLDTDEKLMENGRMVCCMERVEDEPDKEDLGKNEMGTPINEIGEHFSIIPEGERVTCSYYVTKPNGETDFYESFVWERGKGLVSYRSGFRAEAEILYMENISVED